jgi:hypothetical protein
MYLTIFSRLSNAIWRNLAFVILGVFHFSTIWAATYHFYFNNTEQGDQSTATPSLTVHDGNPPEATPSPTPSVAPIEGQKLANSETPPSPVPTGTPSQESPIVTSLMAAKSVLLTERSPRDRKSYFGFGVGAGLNWFVVSPHIQLELGHQFNHNFGVEAFGGMPGRALNRPWNVADESYLGLAVSIAPRSLERFGLGHTRSKTAIGFAYNGRFRNEGFPYLDLGINHTLVPGLELSVSAKVAIVQIRDLSLISSTIQWNL